MNAVRHRFISQVAALSSYVVIVRGLSEHEIGVLSILYALIPILSTLASFGVEQVLRRNEPEYLRAGKIEAAAWLVGVVPSSRTGKLLSEVLHGRESKLLRLLVLVAPAGGKGTGA